MGTTVKIIGSGSTGNGYVVSSCGSAIFLELGCRTELYYEEVIGKGVSVGGCLASHR